MEIPILICAYMSVNCKIKVSLGYRPAVIHSSRKHSVECSQQTFDILTPISRFDDIIILRGFPDIQSGVHRFFQNVTCVSSDYRAVRKNWGNIICKICYLLSHTVKSVQFSSVFPRKLRANNHFFFLFLRHRHCEVTVLRLFLILVWQFIQPTSVLPESFSRLLAVSEILFAAVYSSFIAVVIF